ncbi:MAG TPA: hypothetical protein VEB19_14975, partial [Gemmatimonadaceae bacterium]|nr:hypothetical protein [Gemmatimonadaceae bacterium]
IARAEGRYPEAIQLMWRADTTYDGPNGNCAMCIWEDIGTTYDRAGMADSAIYYWEKYLATPYMNRQSFDASQKPLMLKRLGELHESKGNIPKAVEYYREFIKLWERADPALQPKVAEVRRKLSRLADVEGR